MTNDPKSNKATEKPGEKPTTVREPDNTRPPDEPTPQHGNKPLSTEGEAE